jgi:phosphate/sulfate permease
VLIRIFIFSTCCYFVLQLRHLTAALTQQHSQQQQSALAWQWQFQQAQQHIAFLMSNSSGTNDGLNEMRGRALELGMLDRILDWLYVSIQL